ncbi:MAG TPA: PepSY domain-containing protein [Chthoniobacterales bacterium]|nr:PepSY domain-containing protein [Chthoniobacterales bacterium]
MKRLAILAGTICCLSCQIGDAQPKTPTPTRGNKPSSAATARSPQGSAKQAPGVPESQGKTNDAFGGDDKDRPKGPTDIRCSQEAQFDTKTRSGVFFGNVKVVDPQFTLTTDRLAVRLNKEEDGGGLQEAQADGNVLIVHVNQPKSGQSPATAAPGAQPQAQQPQPQSQPQPHPNSLGADWRLQQDEAREGVRNHQLMPLGRVIEQVRIRTPGRQLDAGLEYQGERPIYRVRWMTKDGRRIDYLIDAVTGAILSGH